MQFGSKSVHSEPDLGPDDRNVSNAPACDTTTRGQKVARRAVERGNGKNGPPTAQMEPSYLTRGASASGCTSPGAEPRLCWQRLSHK